MNERLLVVSATRLSATQFRNNSALGISLRRLAGDDRIRQAVTFENRTGLPELYNRQIRSNPEIDNLVFIHDDVWIEDPFIVDRVAEGLARFDIIGVAGTRRRLPRQPSWMFLDEQWTRDEPQHLSGRVGHGAHPFGELSVYGPIPAPCELLDGVLLAARKSTLIQNDVFFDPRFAFHFYDMDFCRTARAKGLRLATWPIGLTHQSGGNPGSQSWRDSYRIYLDKWTE
jgi:hypothetical protein